MNITQPVTSLYLITFESFIHLKSAQDMILKYQGLDVKQRTQLSCVVFVIFHYYIVQNKPSNLHSLCSMVQYCKLPEYLVNN